MKMESGLLKTKKKKKKKELQLCFPHFVLKPQTHSVIDQMEQKTNHGKKNRTKKTPAADSSMDLK